MPDSDSYHPHPPWPEPAKEEKPKPADKPTEKSADKPAEKGGK